MKRQIGFTLIEIMISLTIGLLVIAATIAVYISTIHGSSDVIKSAQLNHDMDSALALMANDIRRAGFWGKSGMDSDATENPFTQVNTNLFITNGCILYSYDDDFDGVADADEFFGFKLNDGNIQMRLSGNTTNSADCSDGVWQTLNITQGQSKVFISTLDFQPLFNCLRKRTGIADTIWTNQSFDDLSAGEIVTNDRFIETREVAIRLEGYIDDANDDITRNEPIKGTEPEPYHVKIRNDRLITINP